MKISLILFALKFIFFLSFFGLWGDQASAQLEEVLILETQDISPDRPFWVLYKIKAKEGAIIVWPEKGPRSNDLAYWSYPEGVSLGKTLMPTPMEHEFGDNRKFGFKGELVILQEFIPNKRVLVTKTDQNFNLELSLTYEECSSNCISVNKGSKIEIPFGEGHPNPDFIANFRDAREDSPPPSPWPLRATVTPSTFELAVTFDEEKKKNLIGFRFIPSEKGLFRESSAQSRDNNSHILFSPRNWNSKYFGLIEGFLILEMQDGTKENYWVSARNTLPELMDFRIDSPSENRDLNLWLAISLAFLGGLILNLMPCVFPVLSMKVMGLVKAGTISKSRIRLDGIAYSLGILSSFAVLSLALIFLKSAGEQVGWGFQLQSPVFILALIYLFLLVGLNFVGLFEIPSLFAGFGQKLTEKEGVKGPYFTGVLATLVATPCTAPFMAPAIGFALTLEVYQSLAVFLSLGLGLAFPYLLICFLPKTFDYLPKPGNWMITFRRVLSIPMFLSMFWLLWVYNQQVDVLGVFFALICIALIFAWIRFNKKESLLGSLGAVIGVIALTSFSLSQNTPSISGDEAYLEGFEVVEFTNENLDGLRAEGRPVFVNFTAAWCITCLVQEKLVFSQPNIQNYFKENEIIFMKADWTNPNPEITAKLEEFGRSGIPFYLFFPSGEWSEPKILPEIFTPQKFIELLEQAS